MNQNNSLLHPLEKKLLNQLPQAMQIYIAYSGGMDSTVLLHCCLALKHQGLLKSRLAAWHINHQLLPQANSWEEHCINQCKAFNLQIKISRIQVNQQGKDSMEMAARLGRYSLWEEELPTDALLLQAHHQRDQAETLLLRLMRGSRNLHGIPDRRTLGKGLVHRPFLQTPYTEISNYQQEKSLLYIQDPSNLNSSIERNFIRHKLLPLASQKWQAVEANLAHSAERLNLLKEVSAKWIGQEQNLSHHRLSVSALLAMKPIEAELLINAWLEQNNLAILPRPTAVELLKQLKARPDASPKIQWDGVEMHRYGGYLYAMSVLPEANEANKKETPLPFLIKEKKAEYPVRLGSIVITGGEGLQLGIGYRRGGEKIQLNGSRHSLKNLFQQNRVPPWLRPYVPLIYHNNKLVAVAAIHEKQDFLIENTMSVEWKLAPHYGHMTPDK